MKLRDLTTPLYELDKRKVEKLALTEGRRLKEYGRVMPGMGKKKDSRRSGGMSGTTDYQARVAAGKKLEAAIFKKLQELGLQVRNASKKEDMYDKIDFWITVKGKEYPAQIKQREVGDDIIFEVYKDTYNELAPPNGRDYIGKAYFYVVVTPSQRGYVVQTDALKAVVNEYLKDQGIENGFYKGAKFNITNDRATGAQKLMAFFPPDKYGKRIF